MLATLKMVAPFVSKRDIVPEMTALWFHDGRVQATNGHVAIEAPYSFPELGSGLVQPGPLIRKLSLCDRAPKFERDGDVLTITCARKKLRVQVCSDEKFPRVPPPPVEAVGALSIGTLRLLHPFMGDNAAKRHHVSMLLRDGFAYATNGPVIVRTPIECGGPSVTLGILTIRELLKLSIARYEIRVSERGLYLVDDDVWITSHKYDEPWPVEQTDELFAGFSQPPCMDKADILAALDYLEPFAIDERARGPIGQSLDPVVVVFENGIARTVGNSASVNINVPNSRWTFESLRLVVTHATHMDFSLHPRGTFSSGVLQGLISGVRS